MARLCPAEYDDTRRSTGLSRRPPQSRVAKRAGRPGARSVISVCLVATYHIEQAEQPWFFGFQRGFQRGCQAGALDVRLVLPGALVRPRPRTNIDRRTTERWSSRPLEDRKT